MDAGAKMYGGISFGALFLSVALLAGCSDTSETLVVDEATTADMEAADAEESTEAIFDASEDILAWAADADLAASNGPEALLRFATMTRHWEVEASEDCVPAFADQLLADPEALAAPSVRRLDEADRYLLESSTVTVELIATASRIGHLQACEGGAELVEAAANAAAAREKAAEEKAAPSASESAVPAQPPAPASQSPPARSAAPAPTAAPPATSTDTITGTMTVFRAQYLDLDGELAREGSRCGGSGGFDDLVEGAQVRIKNETGAIIATGRLDRGGTVMVSGVTTCVLPFTVSAVPAATYYSIEVSHRGELTYSRPELEAAGWNVSFTVS